MPYIPTRPSLYGDETYVPSYPRKEPRKQYSSVVSQSRKSGAALQLQKGDMVRHSAFGRGMVLTVLPMGNDALLEIAFDEIGTKKLMANTASAHMTKL